MNDINTKQKFQIDELDCRIDVVNFNGSFDLLVSLIKEKKMDIMSINLNEISKQYFQFVIKNIGSIKIDELTEYLLLATYLLEIKSKKVLPSIESITKAEKEIEVDKFIQRILVYKQYQNVAKELAIKYNDRKKMFDKDESYSFDEYFNVECERKEFLPDNIDINKILKAIQKIYLRMERSKKKESPTKIEVNEISIDTVENDIKVFLSNYQELAKITLDEYILTIPEEKFSRQYFVVAFVAILVLVRNGYILIEQDELSSQIFIIKNHVEEVHNEY